MRGNNGKDSDRIGCKRSALNLQSVKLKEKDLAQPRGRKYYKGKSYFMVSL